MAQIVSSIYDLQGLYDNFHDMDLCEDLLRGIYSSDIEKPTEVQQLALMFCLQGYDVIANAPIGTGKTIALLIAILQKIDTTLKNCQALIVVKNFTIASQIKYLLCQLCKFMDVDIFVYMPNHKLSTCHQIVITTPIHALHFVKTPDQSEGIKCLLLDDIENILTCQNTRMLEQLCHSLPCKVQKMLSTTILSKKAYQTCCSLMNNPIKIQLENNKRRLDGIKQYYIAINEIWKLNTIRDLFNGTQ
ncbi:ATP-dependent RNA helicase eIF4A-like [Teleopsis dalmanni]|uniref:ATP-dependent RNA helicase eIF4A-like n=1 Tax=Teleopsis dalmanni TaxID=139649 RepID=UPI0018CF4A63|nr:ATP-dependent RNA helicase eIF4A-like [Teleopsis dalmanni]